ncbi:unnamed protein product [Phytomonas sp. Hart1]|nr:unnamed protein product [Phytomonas sp. Hart1]|eukprot:CCW67904.1 unnamed protein product [Phytomonas sp. isolate Hart1]
MFPWEELVQGREIQRFMNKEADLVAYLIFAYLGMVRYGPGLARRVLGEVPPPTISPSGKKIPQKPPQWLQMCMTLWNLFLAVFSLFGAMVMVPGLMRGIFRYNLKDTVCSTHDELTYTTPVGFWTGVFVLSKILELVDTLWLILEKRKTPSFLHWFHHASVLLFSWISYSMGNSTMSMFACMNIFVHTIMYSYFFICSMGGKKFVQRFSKFITMIQILQMVIGSSLTFYSYCINLSAYRAGIDDIDKLPCAVNKSTARFGCIMYISYLYLFCSMYVQSYIKKKKE